MTVQLFLPAQYLYTGFRNIHETRMTALTYLPTQYSYIYIYIYIGRLNIHWTHVTTLLFLPTQYLYIGCCNIHETHMTALIYLPTQYLYIYIYIYRASQYTLDPCNYPIISANSIFENIQGVSIYMTHMNANNSSIQICELSLKAVKIVCFKMLC